MVWSKELVDVQEFSIGGEQLFLRLAEAELGGSSGIGTQFVAILAIGGLTIVVLIIFLLWKWRATQRGNLRRYPDAKTLQDSLRREKNTDLPIYSLCSVATATDNFSDTNKLGQGGFGPVYKGKLKNGQEIAVKRLSRSSGQGIEEFKNEVVLISKLQHRNLVKLLGCCIENEEELLIYEFMPNKSLDDFLFGMETLE